MFAVQHPLSGLCPALFLAVLTAGCSGSGVSTTARTTGETEEGDVGNDDDDDGSGSADDDDGSASAADDDNSASEADDDGSTDGGSDPTVADDDGSSGGDSSNPEDTGGEPATFEGVWLSEGEDIAPILVELTHAVSIHATFGEQSFTVVTVDEDGQEVQQLGVYTNEESGVGNIWNITLQQTMPSAITVEGIWEIDDSVSPAILRYEVVQTMPSVGAMAPTAEGGFGSTSYGADLTQVFRRQ
jgi:hypothetical protein